MRHRIAPLARPAAPRGERALLYLTEDAGQRRLARRVFAEAGLPYDIVFAQGAAEAFEYLFGVGTYAGRNKLVTPLIMVLDLAEPALGGAELLRRVREDRVMRHVVAVLLTSSSEEARRNAPSSGREIFASRPSDAESFLALARLIDGLLSHQRP